VVTPAKKIRVKIVDLDSVTCSRVKIRLPLVLSRIEIFEIIKHLEISYRLMSEIIYGGGLRLSECLNLRIKEIDLYPHCQS
jgi:integrase